MPIIRNEEILVDNQLKALIDATKTFLFSSISMEKISNFMKALSITSPVLSFIIQLAAVIIFIVLFLKLKRFLFRVDVFIKTVEINSRLAILPPGDREEFRSLPPSQQSLAGS